MAKYNKPNGNNKNIGVIAVSLFFAIAGLILIIIGYQNEIVSWMKTFGIVVLVISTPIIVFVLYQIINKKIKDM